MKRSITVFLLMLVCLLCAAAFASAENLEYTLLEDGSGYEITGCDASAETVVIPAAHEGLPVTAIAGQAFLACENLEAFETEEGQPVFYAEDGVLFTDEPVKTLVRFPNAYPRDYYQAPADVKAVGPWAFAGMRTLNYLHFQEGVESFGDHMLDSVDCWADIYAPASVKVIGDSLLLNQKHSVAFYAPEDSVVCKYAWGNNIPCCAIFDWEVKKQTVELAQPDLTDAEGLPEPKKKEKVTDYIFCGIGYDPAVTCDFSAMQGSPDTELVLDLSREWSEITPDAEGHAPEGRDPRTGLYGIGYTDGETVLRGYDRNGKLSGTRVVSGDFVFSLPEAYSIGVTGGKDTVLRLVPYQPVLTASTGMLPLDISQFHYLAENNRVQYYVIPYPRASVSYDYPFYVNTFGCSVADPSGKAAEDSPRYGIVRMQFADPYMLDHAEKIALKFDHLNLLYEGEDFTCIAASRYNLDETFGTQLHDVLKTVKTAMSGTYYPADRKINPVIVRATGEYPTSADSLITLDDDLAEFKQDNILTYAHEMTHAVDQSVGKGMCSCWMEGRAEYISRKICDSLGVSYWGYEEKYDWSFLAEEYRKDFFSYYTEHANNETYYSVGYYFIKYLCETYGEDVTANIMRNIYDAAAKVPGNEWNIPNDIFKKCVTDATDPDVFQNFVRDVVEK